MGYIKEPKGVDFLIKSEPLTDKDRKDISEFIRKYKDDQKSKKTVSLRKRKSITRGEKV